MDAKERTPESDILFKNAELELSKAYAVLAQLYNKLDGQTNNEKLIAIRAAVRGVANEIEQAQAECRYLRIILDHNRTSLDEMINVARGLQS